MDLDKVKAQHGGVELAGTEFGLQPYVTPLTAVIRTNPSPRITEETVKLALLVGFELGRDCPRGSTYGELERSHYPLTWSHFK